MRGTTRDLTLQAFQHTAVSTAPTALRIMRSLNFLRLPRRWQARYALSISLLACIISCIVARGESEGSVPTMRRYLRQLPFERVDAQPSQEDRELSIFGKDNREQVTDPSTYPYSTVGLLRWNDDTTCTATLVAPGIVLTAAECVLDSNGNLLKTSGGSSVFTLPQATGIQTASVTRVHRQSDFWIKWTQNTYVLVELDNNLGTTNGALHLPTANSFVQDTPMEVQIVGYRSSGEVGECYQMCTIYFPNEFGGPEYMLHHDCDVSAKFSPGSPMLIRSTNFDTYIIGIHTNAIGNDIIEDNVTETYPSYNDSVANRGVLTSFVQPQLAYLLQHSDSSTAADSPGTTQPAGSDIPASSSSKFFVGSASNSHSNSQRHGDQGNAGASAASAPQTASSSSAESSVAAPQIGIAATAAYLCIGLVCASWLAIIFVAARRIRANR